MRVKVYDFDGTLLDLGRMHVVVTLSGRNVQSLYHQAGVSLNAEDADRPRQIYGSLHKRFEDGPAMTVHIEPDDQHYDEDGIARLETGGRE